MPAFPVSLPSFLPRFHRLPPPPGHVLLLAPLSAVCSRLVRSVLARHPGVLHRMGEAGESRFLIDLVDMPLTVLIQPGRGSAQVMWRMGRPPAHDAAIRGRLPAFLAMLHAGEDGDALFFSGELMISGDTAAVLSLRNALDDAELDLTDEVASLNGLFGPLLRRFGRVAERLSGYSLSRAQPLSWEAAQQGIGQQGVAQ